MTAISPTPNPAARPPPATTTNVVKAESGPCAFRRVMGRPDENEREQDCGDAVIEQALGFDEQAQPAGHAPIPGAAR